MPSSEEHSGHNRTEEYYIISNTLSTLAGEDLLPQKYWGKVRTVGELVAVSGETESWQCAFFSPIVCAAQLSSFSIYMRKYHG